MNLAALLTDSRKMVYIMGAGIALLVLLSMVLVVRNMGFGGDANTAAELQVWGVFDDPVVMTGAIKAFEKENPKIKASYRLIPYADYERTVVNALAAGQGPDVWMVHHTWLPKHLDKLTPMPATMPDTNQPLITSRQFSDLFVDVVNADMVNDKKIYALPLYVDTLALYYNRDMLASAGITRPPTTWREFLDDVAKLTQFDTARNITRAGAALGMARNINRSTDILMMLMLQSGVHMTSDARSQATFSQSVSNEPVGQTALQHYTDYSDPRKEVYTWNDTMDYSVDAFSAGKVAFMFNYAHQMQLIRDKAPRLNWGVAPVPQATTVAGGSRTYANYWALAVSNASKYPVQAWKFVHYLTAGNGSPLYLNASGRPAARKDLIEQQKNTEGIGVFAEQALTARSWYQVDNVAIETIFANMIDDVTRGRRSIPEALKDAEDKVTVLMR